MDIKHLAKLANLPLSKQALHSLAVQIRTTFTYIDTLKATDTQNIPETNQVTGLTNVMREDLVDNSRMFNQAQALENAPHTYRGYFVVSRILE